MSAHRIFWLDLEEEASSITTEVNPHEGYFHVIMAGFDQLEDRLESLINNRNEPKDLLLSLSNKFQLFMVKFERLEVKTKKLTNKREYKKTKLYRSEWKLTRAKQETIKNPNGINFYAYSARSPKMGLVLEKELLRKFRIK